MTWIREWYMVLVPTLFVAIMCWAMSVSREMAIAVPVQYCEAHFTGRAKSEDVPIQSCAAYDKNMTCTAPITTWSTVTRSETRVTCDFIEWR